jgi:hypothetical protein
MNDWSTENATVATIAASSTTVPREGRSEGDIAPIVSHLRRGANSG